MNQQSIDQDSRSLLHESQLAQWNKMYEAALHSDKIASSIGVFFLKAVITVNGGALIALLALYPHTESIANVGSAFVEVMICFIIGITTALLSGGIAYFYQSFVTASSWNDFHEAFDSSEEAPYPWADTGAMLFRFPMIASAIVAGLSIVAGLALMLHKF